MRRLPDEVLPPHVQAALTAAHEALIQVGDYEARVCATDQHWKRARAGVVGPVRDVLRAMCGEAEPCCYCEDSVGATVEHVRPRSLYPDLTFDWFNLLLACGACNTIKNAGFAVLVDGREVPVARKRDAPIVPPMDGPMALIDLRREDPLKFFRLNLARGVLLPHRDLEAVCDVRARFTRKLLKLNRDPLPTRRVHHYGHFRARLCEYVLGRERDPSNPMIASKKAELLRLPHQIVWREMQRQQESIPELHALFGAAPEALTW